MRMQSSRGGTRSASASVPPGFHLPTAKSTNTPSTFSPQHIWVAKCYLSITEVYCYVIWVMQTIRRAVMWWLGVEQAYRRSGGSPPADWPARHSSTGQTGPDWPIAPSAGQTAHWSGSHCTAARWGTGASSGRLPPQNQATKRQELASWPVPHTHCFLKQNAAAFPYSFLTLQML